MAKAEHSCIWFEIPVRDLEQGKKFYGDVLSVGFVDQSDAPNPFSIFDIEGASEKPAGHLYPGTPAKDGTGPTIHLAVSGQLEDALERVKKSGGRVLSEPIEIPAGRFAYCLDPDGNGFALFKR